MGTMLNHEQLLSRFATRSTTRPRPGSCCSALKMPREQRATFKRLLGGPRRARRPRPDPRQPVRPARPDEPGRRHGWSPTRAASASSSRTGRSRDVNGDIFIAGSNLNQAMHGDRVVARIERVTRRPRRGAHRARSSSAAPRRSSAGSTSTESGIGLRRAVRPAADHGRPDPADEQLDAQARRHGRRRDHPVADADARAARPGHRSARRHRRAGRRQRDHHPQVRHPRRAQRRGGRGSAAPRRRRSREKDLARPHRFPAADHRHHRRRARARLRRRDHDRAAAERQLLARRAHRRRRALRAGGQRARRGSLRARHVGVFPGPRRSHVSVGAVDRPLQPQSERRSAGAVVPDGNRSARATSSATRCTTA